MPLTLGTGLGALGGGNPVIGGLGLLSGFLGRQKMPAAQRNLLRISAGAANKLYNYSQGVPGSSPQELAALAQQKALLGEDQLNQQRQAYAALAPNQGGTQTPNLADFMMGLQSQQTAQRMALEQNHLLNALAQRQAALGQAAGIAQNTQNLATYNQQSAFPALFQQLSSALAYKQALQAANKAGGGAGTVNAVQGLLSGTGGTGGKAAPAPVGNASVQGINAALGYSPTNPGAWSIPGAQSGGGLVAPGNEQMGMNSTANQIRQPIWGPLASGLRFG